LRTIILLATAAVVLALCVDVYTLGSSVAPQASLYALAPMTASPIEGRAAYVDAVYGESSIRHAVKGHASQR
jgi:hypothetical protein